MDLSHVQGIGQGNGRFQGAQLLDLGDAGGFSKAVMDKGRCRQPGGKDILLTGKDHRYPRFMFFCVHRIVTHPYSWHVCQLI